MTVPVISMGPARNAGVGANTGLGEVMNMLSTLTSIRSSYVLPEEASATRCSVEMPSGTSSSFHSASFPFATSLFELAIVLNAVGATPTPHSRRQDARPGPDTDPNTVTVVLAEIDLVGDERWAASGVGSSRAPRAS